MGFHKNSFRNHLLCLMGPWTSPLALLWWTAAEYLTIFFHPKPLIAEMIWTLGLPLELVRNQIQYFIPNFTHLSQWFRGRRYFNISLCISMVQTIDPGEGPFWTLVSLAVLEKKIFKYTARHHHRWLIGQFVVSYQSNLISFEETPNY